MQDHLIKLNAKNDIAHALLNTGEQMLQSYKCHPFQTVQIRSSLAKLKRSCDAAKKQAKKKKVGEHQQLDLSNNRYEMTYSQGTQFLTKHVRYPINTIEKLVRKG